MITVRASTLDSFRLYLDPDVDFIDTEEIEARLCRGQDDEDGAPSEAAALGTAFQDAVNGDYDGEIEFDPASLAAVSLDLGDAARECEGSVVLDVDGVPVRVTGHTDYLLGLAMVELKTSSKPIAADKYADSMQWRAYVLIFGVEQITYRQVQLAEDKHGIVYAKAIDDVTMFAYPALRDDVIACLRALLAFARVRGCLDAMEVAA